MSLCAEKNTNVEAITTYRVSAPLNDREGFCSINGIARLRDAVLVLDRSHQNLTPSEVGEFSSLTMTMRSANSL